MGPLCAAAALAVGCVGYEPDPLVPPDELLALMQRGTTWHDDDEPRVGGSIAGAETWFPLVEDVDLTDGLTLGEANALALFYAPALVAERTRHRIAAAQLLQAGLLPNPELFVGPRLSTDDAGLVLPAWLAFQIPLSDQLGAEEETAAAKLDSARWEVMRAELEVLRDIRLMFVRIAALREERATLESLQAEAQRIVAWVEELATAGQVDALTVRLARLERDDVSATMGQLDIDILRESTELLGFVGLHPAATVEPTTTGALLSGPDLPAADPDSVLRHPGLRARESAYREAEGFLRLQVAKQYPMLRIGPDLEYDRGDLQLGLGIGLPLPIFDQNQGQIAEATERRRGAREAYQATLLTLAAEEAAGRREMRVAADQLRAQHEGPLQSAEQAGRALAARLRGGLAGILEVLSARRAIMRTRVRETRLRRQIAEAGLRAAVAGGFVLEDDSGSAPGEREEE